MIRSPVDIKKCLPIPCMIVKPSTPVLAMKPPLHKPSSSLSADIADIQTKIKTHLKTLLGIKGESDAADSIKVCTGVLYSLDNLIQEKKEFKKAIEIHKGVIQYIEDSHIASKLSQKNMHNLSIDSLKESYNRLKQYEILVEETKSRLASLDKIIGAENFVADKSSAKKALEERDKYIIDTLKYYLACDEQIQEDIATSTLTKETRDIQAVDILFLSDGTGSMRNIIQQIKDKIFDIVDEVKNTFPSVNLRFGAVIYRDIEDSMIRFERLEFSENIDEFKGFFGKISATGGGDSAEDINGGLKQVLTMNWINNTKCLIHFADAPCHGKQYHSMNSDDYPNGYKEDTDYTELFTQMKSLGIEYYFMRINHSTDIMVEKFKSYWKNAPRFKSNIGRMPKFTMLEYSIEPRAFIDQVKYSIVDSITRSSTIKTFHHTLAKDAKYIGALELETLPKPKEIHDIFEEDIKIKAPITFLKSSYNTITGTLVSLNPETTQEFLSGRRHLPTDFIEVDLKIDIEEKSFQKGAFNYAYRGIIHPTQHPVVLKYPIRAPKVEEISVYKHQLKKELKKNCLAITLAQKYNKKLQGKYPWANIEYAQVFLFQTKGKTYWVEGYIDGFIRYSNNYDYLDTSKETRHLTAFAHFSYEETKKAYLITDFQGGSTLLTDPVIHSKTREFRESGDFGRQGIKMFFSKHICNNICKQLGLNQESIGDINLAWKEIAKPHSHSSKRKMKCVAKICNKVIEIESKLASSSKEKWCRFCQNILETANLQLEKCLKCKVNFQIRGVEFIMAGLPQPKECGKCRDNTKNKGMLVWK